MKNIIRVLFLFTMLTFITGCAKSNQLTSLQKENDRLNLEVDRKNIDNQEKCSQGSREFFNTYMDKEGEYAKKYEYSKYNYTNHYSKKIGKCFIVIKFGDISSKYSAILYDVYENKEVGSVYTVEKTSEMCGLLIEGSYKSCTGSAVSAQTEFDRLSEEYMLN